MEKIHRNWTEKSDPVRTVLLTFALTATFFVANIVVVIFWALTLVPLWLSVRLLAKLLRPDLGSIISDMTTNFTIYSQNKCAASLVHYLVLDGPMTLQRFRQLWFERVLCARRPNGELLFNRFRDTWTHYCGYPFWRLEEQFSIRHHVRNYDLKGPLALPAPCYETDLKEVMGLVASKLYGTKRSPWEVLLIHDFRTDDDPNKPKTVVLFRHHHALIDGYGLVSLMRCLFDDGTYTMPPLNFPHVPLWFRILAPLRMPYDTAQMLINAYDGLKDWHVGSETPRELESTMTSAIPVAKVKLIKDRLKVSYTTVIFAAIAGALERVARESKMAVPQNVGAHFPIPKPGHPGGSVNHMFIVGSRWELAGRTPLERARFIHTQLRKLAYSTIPEVGHWTAKGIALVPTFLLRNAFIPLISRGSLIISVFPATTDQVYLDATKVYTLYSSLGVPYGNPSVGVLVTGCNGNQHAVVTWNKHVFPNPAFGHISNYLEEELNKLLRA